VNEPDVLTVYTTSRCGDCDAAKRALSSLGVPFREVRLDERPEAIDFVLAVNEGRRSVPTLHYRGHAASLSRFDRRRLDAFLDRSGAHAAAQRHDRHD
jgi:mycoredoxin